MSSRFSSSNNALGLSSIDAYPPSQIQRSTSNGDAHANAQAPLMNSAIGAPHIRPVNLPNSPYHTGLLTPAQSPYITNRNLGPGSPPLSSNSNFDIHPSMLYAPNRLPTINYDISSSVPSTNESFLNTPITLPPISNSIRLSYHVYSTSNHQTKVIPFPWCLTISPVNTINHQIITIHALFAQIHLSLTHTIVSDTEFRRFNLQEQQLARASYERRRAKSGGATANSGGLIRSDFLLGCTRFMGLTKGADGGLVVVLSDVGISRN